MTLGTTLAFGSFIKGQLYRVGLFLGAPGRAYSCGCKFRRKSITSNEVKLMTQGRNNAVQAAVLFEVGNGKVARYAVKAK
ncbi:hypothetical protein AGMMS50225_19750 [Betaproteobacteria bacterium]|nr:hypothetical protein AGMMS50225_19750 [Betaproteobacteria bacterium]